MNNGHAKDTVVPQPSCSRHPLDPTRPSACILVCDVHCSRAVVLVVTAESLKPDRCLYRHVSTWLPPFNSWHNQPPYPERTISTCGGLDNSAGLSRQNVVIEDAFSSLLRPHYCFGCVGWQMSTVFILNTHMAQRWRLQFVPNCQLSTTVL